MKRTSEGNNSYSKNEDLIKKPSFIRSRLGESKNFAEDEKIIHRKIQKAKSIPKIRSILLVVILMIIFCSTIYNYFKIKKIEYDGKNIQANDQFLDKSYLFINVKEKEKNLQILFPNLTIKVKKYFPNKILINAIDNEGFVLLITPEGKKSVINKDGVILSIFSKENGFLLNEKLVKIETQIRGLLSDAKTNQSISNQQILQIIKVLSSLGDKILIINQVRIDSSTDVIIDFGEYEWSFTLKKDVNPQIRAFSLIFDEMLNTGKKFSSIDTRFNQPLVRY